ncbi:MAG: LysR family transcriptional regulator [Myxococcota bacterium]
MDLQDLRCFTAAAATVSFRAAARRVALSPAAFGERIRRLEDDVGGALFRRTSRRAELTEAGHRLLPHAMHLLDAADRCREIVAQDSGPAPYALTIGTRFELGLSWLCPALGGLKAARPERSLHLFFGDAPDLTARVERGDVDAVVFSARLTSPRIEYLTLHRETYVFVGAPAAPHTTLLDVSPDLPLFRYLTDPGEWRFESHEYLGSIGAIRFRLLEGAGVAVLPEYYVRADLDDGRLRLLSPGGALAEDAFRLVWRAGHPRTDRLRELGEELRLRPLR